MHAYIWSVPYLIPSYLSHKTLVYILLENLFSGDVAFFRSFIAILHVVKEYPDRHFEYSRERNEKVNKAFSWILPLYMK